MKYLIKSSKLCYGLSRNDLRHLAFEFAKKIKIDYPETWKKHELAGEGWYAGFMRRK